MNTPDLISDHTLDCGFERRLDQSTHRQNNSQITDTSRTSSRVEYPDSLSDSSDCHSFNEPEPPRQPDREDLAARTIQSFWRRIRKTRQQVSRNVPIDITDELVAVDKIDSNLQSFEQLKDFELEEEIVNRHKESRQDDQLNLSNANDCGSLDTTRIGSDIDQLTIEEILYDVELMKRAASGMKIPSPDKESGKKKCAFYNGDEWRSKRASTGKSDVMMTKLPSISTRTKLESDVESFIDEPNHRTAIKDQRNNTGNHLYSPRNFSHECFNDVMKIKDRHNRREVGRVIETKQYNNSAECYSVITKTALRQQPSSGNTCYDEECDDVDQLRLALTDRQSTIDRLRRSIDQQRQLSLRQLTNLQAEMDSRLEAQRSDCDASLERSQKLIDAMLEEKRALHDKCEQLVEELSKVVKSSEQKLNAVEQRYRIELKNVEAKFVANEKQRRTKWETEKLKQLKAVTLRGMEVELGEMAEKHKADLRRLQESCADRVKQSDARAYETYLGHIDDLRKKLLNDQEQACGRERENGTRRLEQAVEDERHNLEVRHQRVANQLTGERDEALKQLTETRAEFESVRFSLERQLEETRKESRRAIELVHEQTKARYEHDKADAKRDLDNQLGVKEGELKAKFEVDLVQRVDQVRRELKEERDRQLEAAVRCIEQKSSQMKHEVESEAEAKIKRIRDKLMTELGEAEQSEKQVQEKYKQTKIQLQEKLIECDQQRLQLTQVKQQLAQVEQVKDKLEAERSNLTDLLRQEIADHLVDLERDNATLKRQLAESEARLKQADKARQAELVHAGKLKAIELEALNTRFKQVIEQKEDQFKVQLDQFQSRFDKVVLERDKVNQRADYLEEMLDEQRKQFLSAGGKSTKKAESRSK